MRYAIIGTGAIGGFYGGRLARAGFDVHFLLHSDFEYVRDNGLRVDSYDGSFVISHPQAYASVADMPPCDVVIVALKTTANGGLPAMLAPLLTERTLVLLIQNGVGVEADVEAALPGVQLAAGLAYICTTKVGPGHIEHTSNGKLSVANYSCRDQGLIDGLLADLGVSSHHLDDAARGFSFRFDAPLDMRMNKRAGATAADVLNSYSEERLSDVLYLYGELRNARRLAAAIVRARQSAPLLTTSDLMGAVGGLLPQQRAKKDAARLFQALRIEVNGEMEALKMALEQSLKVLRPGGRLVVISYHSLEDRLVKNFLRSGNFEGRIEKDFFGKPETPFEIITRKAVTPSSEELVRNPRSRSAKLRAAAKIVRQ